MYSRFFASLRMTIICQLFTQRIRLVSLSLSATLVRRCTHHKFQYAAFGNILVSDIHLGVRLAVQADRLDVALLVTYTRCLDFEGFSVRQRELEGWQVRSTQYVLVGSRTNGVEAHGSEQIPSRHLTAIVITTQSADVVLVHAVHHLAHPVLGLPRL